MRSKDALVEACRPLMGEKSAIEGYHKISGKFRDVDDFAPTCLTAFVEREGIMDGRTGEEWQQEAYGQVRTWLDSMGFWLCSTAIDQLRA